MKVFSRLLAAYSFLLILGLTSVLGQVVFEKVYPFPNGVFGAQQDLQPVYDGGYILESSFPGSFGQLMRTDRFGNVLWAEKYGFFDGFSIGVDSTHIYGVADNSILKIRLSDGGLVWSKIFAPAGPGVTFFYHLRMKPYGNFIVSGTATPDVAVAEFDTSGTVIWSKKYSLSATTDFGDAIFATADSGAIVSGRYNASLTTDDFIMKLSPTGVVEWTRTISTAGYTILGLNIAESANEYIIDGTDASNPVASNFLFGLSKDGNNVNWNRSSNYLLYPYVDPSENLYVAGVVYTSKNSFLARLNSSGDTLWAKGYGSGSCRTIQGITGHDAHEVAVYSECNGFTTYPSAHLMVVDSLGNGICTGYSPGIVWEDTLSFTPGFLSVSGIANPLNVNPQVISLASDSTTDSTLCLSCTIPVSFTGLDTFYCSTDGPATLSGSPTGGSFSGPGISGNVFSPATVGPDTIMITYLYADTNGCSGASSQTVIVDVCTSSFGPKVTESVDVFPVPSSGILQLSITGFQNRSGTFSLFDLQGKLVAESEFTLQDGRTSIDFSGQFKGVYFARITCEGITVTRKVVLL